MITGAHSIIYSKDAEADRVFLRDVLKLTNVDVGGGWLIFGLPPAEVAVHPSEKNDVHEFYFMCDDLEVFIAELKEHHIACDPVEDQGWGLLTQLTLPGGEARYLSGPARATETDDRRAGEMTSNQTLQPTAGRCSKKGEG